MSQNLDFKKRFGQKITQEEVRQNFVTKINHSLLPAIEEQIGSYYSELGSNSRYDSPGSRMFDYICINFGLEPKEVIYQYNRNSFGGSHNVPSLKRITNKDFEKTLQLVEIIYGYFKTHQHYRSQEFLGAIDSMVNEFLLQPLSLGVFWRAGCFYPEGATELDQALIREPLDWMSNYVKVQQLFKNALENYAQTKTNEIKRKDTCINAYQAVEEVAKVVFGNEKKFDSNYKEFAEKIGLQSHWVTILNQYRCFSQEFGRHPGTGDNFIPDAPSTEAFLYLSGLILRLAFRKLESKA